MAEELKATSVGGSKGGSDDLDAMIRETLAENRKKDIPPKKEEEKSSGFKATHVKIAPKPKPAEKALEESEGAAPTAKQVEAVSYEATFKSYKAGDVVRGTVVKVDPSGVLADINYKSDVLIAPSELTDKSISNIHEIIKVGDKIDVMIMKLEDKDGYMVGSKKQAEQELKWQTAFDAYKGRKVLEGKVTGAVKGGLVVDYSGIRGFIPASQVAKEAEDQSLESFVGKTLPIKVIEINRRQGKIVLSHKMAAGDKHKIEASKIFDELEVGQTRHGTVTSIKNFGAFVDVGGAEGLVHLTELAWKRVNHPSDLLKVGQELDVFVLGVDKESKKISLGLKQLQPDPWVTAADLYKPGMIVDAKIARFVKFGAFVELDGNLEGLIHITELSDKPVSKPEEAVKVGDVVKVKVLKVLPEEQKIGLSIKEVKKDADRKEMTEYKQTEAKSHVTIGDMIKEKHPE